MFLPALALRCGLPSWCERTQREVDADHACTVQENTILQTLVGSISGTMFTGGFGSYLTAMDEQTYKNLGGQKGNRPQVGCLHCSAMCQPGSSCVSCKCIVLVVRLPQDVYDPTLWRVFAYLLCISLMGTFILLSFRKTFIIDLNLPYPSGTAAGVLLNSLHNTKAGGIAQQQAWLMPLFAAVSAAASM